jgi:hypothetical protein
MNEKQESSIWGLNFLQDAKETPAEITGAYDPEQEVWIMQGQVQSLWGKSHLNPWAKPYKPIVTKVPTRYRTPMITEVPGRPNKDEEHDYDLDGRDD